MTPARRWAALAAPLLLGAGLLSACSGTTTSYAATVNGTTISRATLLRELHALGANAAFVTTYDASVAQAASQGQSLSPIFAKGTASATYTQGFTAIVLNTDVQAQLIHDEVVRRHIEPTAAAIAAATAAASQQFPNDAAGKPVFPAFDPWFQQEFKVRAAEQAVLAKALGPVPTTAAAVQAFYDANQPDFITTECVSHILVAHQADAVSIRRSLASGSDFATEARKYSTDTGSAIKGGDLGCNPPGGYVAPFERVADTIALNQVSPPVQSQFGWHLIEVRSRTIQPLDAANKTRIQQFLQQESPIGAFVTPALKVATVKVNTAYGSWDPTQPGVVPPVAPPSGSGVPTTPPTTAAPGGSGPVATVPTVTPGSTPATAPPATAPSGTAGSGSAPATSTP